jgi:tetratricopeptide (TPR) repeat protein
MAAPTGAKWQAGWMLPVAVFQSCHGHEIRAGQFSDSLKPIDFRELAIVISREGSDQFRDEKSPLLAQKAREKWGTHQKNINREGHEVAPRKTVCSNLASELAIMDRIAALNEILTENPKDAFARYGLAMEYSKQGDFDRALAEFSILIENHPDYTAGYFMAAQTLVKAERSDDAKKMLHDGVASARRTGNLHAQSEMEALLGELG